MSPPEKSTTAADAPPPASSPTRNESTERLLDADFMKKLDRWSLAVRRTLGGQYAGERRSSRHGQSIEFADFRNYVAGDDTRFVDWNLYARMERLYLKLFLHEEELNVHILVDLSESMTFGKPSKALVARRLAAALGYMALSNQDGLSIALGSGGIAPREGIFPLARGRGYGPRMLWFLQNAPQGGRLGLRAFVESALTRIRRPGLVILISDLMDPEGHEQAIRSIVARRHEAIVMHVLSEEEWDPDFKGDLRLIDAEEEVPTEISVTPELMRRYRQRVEAWSASLEQFCGRRGVTYLRLVGSPSIEDAVLGSLRRLGRLG